MLVDCGGASVHRDIALPWRNLQASAARAGFTLTAASAYRDYDRQLQIWNDKASGLRPVFDDDGHPVPMAQLDDTARLFAILRFSALPGASRHHWGTDLDVYDRAAVDSDYAVQLTATEVEHPGPFAPLHDWLDQQIANACSEGFYRPYCGQNALAAERWHLSHRPTAGAFASALDAKRLFEHYQQAEGLALRESVLDNFDLIYRDYICCE